MIWRAWEANASSWDSLGFSPSMISSECDRELWLQLRWAFGREVFKGRMLRLFNTGFREEDRIVADLRMAGLEVAEVDPSTGRQFGVKALAGHVRGKMDGLVLGVPEAPTKWHILEAKSHNTKSFGKLIAAGAGNLQKGKFEHWVQCQTYMHVYGIDRCLYSATNKNDDERWNDRVYYDHEFCVRLFLRLEAIIRRDTPPPPIAEMRNAPACLFCKKKAVCKGESFAPVSCRTCLHSTPTFDGDAAWACSRWSKPLGRDEQREACPAHLFIPDLVPGVMGEVDEAAETISYTLTNGQIWVDGHEPSPAPLDVEVEDAR